MKRGIYLLSTLFIVLLVLSSLSVAGESPASLFFGDEDPLACGPDSESCAIDGSDVQEESDIDDFASLIETMAHDENQVCIVYFYSPKCAHCNNIKPFINAMEEKYKDGAHFTRLDVTEPKNVMIYNRLCQAKEYSGNEIPLLAVNDVVLVGENQIRDRLEEEIERGMEMEEKICPVGQMSCHAGEPTGTNPMLEGVDKLSFFAILPLVLATGLSDGINPCAFAVLLFVMAFLQEISGNKRRLRNVTLSYIISFMIVNMLLGVFYYFTSMQIGHPVAIRYTAMGFAVFAGLINLKDFFAYGKGFSLKIPGFSKRYIEGLAAKATVPASVVLGSSVALLEAPCSVPIYLTVLEVLKGQGKTILGVMPHILIYNIAFILPLAVLAGLIYYGAEAKALEGWRESHKRFMKLSLALILFFFVGLMAFGVI